MPGHYNNVRYVPGEGTSKRFQIPGEGTSKQFQVPGGGEVKSWAPGNLKTFSTICGTFMLNVVLGRGSLME